jgi:epoxyqueuosine reductase
MSGWHSGRERKAALIAEAHRLGFELAGIAPAARAETAGAFFEWLHAGHLGEMGYLARDPERRTDSRLVWPETTSILVVGMRHARAGSLAPGPTKGAIARYALGDDYHDVLAARLRALLGWAQASWGMSVRGRWYVDTGPLLERDLAARAGLGWFGKNTCLLNRSHGSYFFLGALLLNLALPPDTPTTAHCGTCSRCLEICPTGAFQGPYSLDARRCISYLTIELRGPIPHEFRPAIGNWIFGCDLCQEVCPWNRKPPEITEPTFLPRAGLQSPELRRLLYLTQAEFSELFRRSPVKRARRRGLLRNVCVALGNSEDAGAIPDLIWALGHEEPLVRGHAAWALGRLGTPSAREALAAAAGREADPWVNEEIAGALAEWHTTHELPQQ